MSEKASGARKPNTNKVKVKRKMNSSARHAGRKPTSLKSGK